MRVHLAGMPSLEAEGYTAILQQWVRLELRSDESLVTVYDKKGADVTGAGETWAQAVGLALVSRLAPGAKVGRPGYYAGLLLPTVVMPEKEESKRGE